MSRVHDGGEPVPLHETEEQARAREAEIARLEAIPTLAERPRVVNPWEWRIRWP